MAILNMLTAHYAMQINQFKDSFKFIAIDKKS